MGEEMVGLEAWGLGMRRANAFRAVEKARAMQIGNYNSSERSGATADSGKRRIDTCLQY